MNRISPVVFEANISEEEKKNRWHSPENEIDPFEKCANEAEKLKK